LEAEAIGRAAGCLLYFAVPMPKMKTHSGAKKRFRKTATGKLRGRHAFSSHILEKKPPKRKRRFASPVEISPADRKRVRTLLGRKGAGR
jgi:large subunit ribosomal protein L35